MAYGVDSFNGREITTDKGQPISLYKLKWGNTIWRYTSSDRIVIRVEDDGAGPVDVTYFPVACRDEGMVQGGSANGFTLHIPGNLPIVDLFRSTPPTQSIWLTVRRMHDALTGDPVVSTPVGAHKYWRVFIAQSQGDFIGLANIEFREEAGGFPVAGTPIASSTYDPVDERLDYAFDGNTATQWRASQLTNEWIGIEFATPKTIREIFVQAGSHDQSRMPYTGHVDFSDDGITWTSLYELKPFAPWLRLEGRLLTAPVDATEVDAPIYWVGTVGNVQRPDPAKGVIIGRPISATFNRAGLRLCWTRGCPYALYDSDCGVLAADEKIEATVLSINGNSVKLDVDTGLTPAVNFIGGILEWVANIDGTTDRRTIEDVLGGPGDFTFVLFGSADRIPISAIAALYPGCDYSAGTCDFRFNNLANYGGFEQMVGDSPFTGKPVF